MGFLKHLILKVQSMSHNMDKFIIYKLIIFCTIFIMTG